MSDFDGFSGLQAMAENMPDGRPVFPLVGDDRYFDEPDPEEEGPVTGFLGWGARASAAQRSGMLKLVQWMAEAPDAERRVILVLFERFQGRLPGGAVNDLSETAGTSRETVRVAIKRFAKYFPEAIDKHRRRLQ